MNQYKAYIIISLIIISISIFFIIKTINNSADLITVVSLQKLPLKIENQSDDFIIANKEKIKPQESKNFYLDQNKKIIITHNTGTVIIKTFEKIYKIKLKSFEVVINNGEN